MKTLVKPISVPARKYANLTIRNIYERRAIRKYKPRPVEIKLVEQILDAGRMAPSAMNKQPCRFYILSDKEEIKFFSKEISRVIIKGILRSGIKDMIKAAKELLHFPHGKDFIKKEDPVFHGAPVVIFITTPIDYEWAAIDTGMCAQNIMLAAKSLGLDTCPVGMGKFAAEVKEYKKLKIRAGEKIQLAVTLGYGDEIAELKERNKNNVVFL